MIMLIAVAFLMNFWWLLILIPLIGGAIIGLVCDE